MACKADRGITKRVIQDKEKNPVAQRAERGTFKAAVLEGDPGCQNLTASRLYDTNPVHYLSMVSESIQWAEKENMVYTVDTGNVEDLKLFILDQINKYNNVMVDVKVADKLRGVYRLDRWVRNRR